MCIYIYIWIYINTYKFGDNLDLSLPTMALQPMQPLSNLFSVVIA